MRSIRILEYASSSESKLITIQEKTSVLDLKNLLAPNIELVRFLNLFQLQEDIEFTSERFLVNESESDLIPPLINQVFQVSPLLDDRALLVDIFPEIKLESPQLVHILFSWVAFDFFPPAYSEPALNRRHTTMFVNCL